MTNEPIVQLKNVTRTFGDVIAVDNLSLTLNAGEILVFLGQSGCGKTTTLRLIAGLEKPDHGEIRINNEQVAGGNRWIPPEHRHIGMVFQDYALFPHITIAENIAFGLKGKRKEKSRRIKDMLELVDLEGYGQRMPHELSGGQQQRVALARALAPAPDILLLDEPFSNLDTALRSQVRAEIRQILRKTQTTAIFVTHDQEEALSISDKVAVMVAGQAVQIAAPQTIYNTPVNRELAHFIGEASFIPAEARGKEAACVLGTVQLQTEIRGRVDLLIRPEMIQLTDDGIPARIIWQEYYGHSQRIGLQLEDGTRLTARASSTVPRLRGYTVKITIDRPVHAFSAL